MFLSSAGFDFRSLESARDFLSLYKPVKGDLLVLDLSLPDISGCDLLKKIDEAGIYIPVIVVTSTDDQLNRETCRKYGVKAFLRKPVDGEALVDLIKYNLVS
jgi:two-component system, LuxR family, response regulator FixJ